MPPDGIHGEVVHVPPDVETLPDSAMQTKVTAICDTTSELVHSHTLSAKSMNPSSIYVSLDVHGQHTLSWSSDVCVDGGEILPKGSCNLVRPMCTVAHETHMNDMLHAHASLAPVQLWDLFVHSTSFLLATQPTGPV